MTMVWKIVNFEHMRLLQYIHELIIEISNDKNIKIFSIINDYR